MALAQFRDRGGKRPAEAGRELTRPRESSPPGSIPPAHPGPNRPLRVRFDLRCVPVRSSCVRFDPRVLGSILCVPVRSSALPVQSFAVRFDPSRPGSILRAPGSILRAPGSISRSRFDLRAPGSILRVRSIPRCSLVRSRAPGRSPARPVSISAPYAFTDGATVVSSQPCASSAPSTAAHTVSVRSAKGPSVTREEPGRLRRRQLRAREPALGPDGERDGRASRAPRALRRAAASARRVEAEAERRSGRRERGAPRAKRQRGPRSSGASPRPHCRAASTAMRRHRAARAGVGPRHAPRADRGHDARRAELGRVAHDGVELVALADPLDERHGPRRPRLAGRGSPTSHDHGPAPDVDDLGVGLDGAIRIEDARAGRPGPRRWTRAT